MKEEKFSTKSTRLARIYAEQQTEDKYIQQLLVNAYLQGQNDLLRDQIDREKEKVSS